MGGAPQGGGRRRGAERQDHPRGGLPPLRAHRGGVPLLAARLPEPRPPRSARPSRPAIPPPARAATAQTAPLTAVPPGRAGVPKDLLITLCSVEPVAQRGGMDISVVIPVYNEVDALPGLHRALADT